MVIILIYYLFSFLFWMFLLLIICCFCVFVYVSIFIHCLFTFDLYCFALFLVRCLIFLLYYNLFFVFLAIRPSFETPLRGRTERGFSFLRWGGFSINNRHKNLVLLYFWGFRPVFYWLKSTAFYCFRIISFLWRNNNGWEDFQGAGCCVGDTSASALFVSSLGRNLGFYF